MARNRRQSESITFAVGRGCFLFLIGALCVGFSVTKIIVGSEYVSKCPSREMIPVYIIVSGCLPVLLSALRQPYDGGHEMDKDKWSMKVTLFTAVIGVMVNLAWLVAGTYLVVTVWNGNICNATQLTTPETSSFPFNVSTSVSNGSFSVQNNNNWQNSNAIQYQVTAKGKEVEEKDRVLNETDLGIMDLIKSGVQTEAPESPLGQTLKITEDMIKSTTGPAVTAETGINENVPLRTGFNYTDKVNVSDISKEKIKTSDTSVKIGTENKQNISKFTEISVKKEKDETANKKNTDIFKKPSLNKHCITCDVNIIRFSMAVIVIDWLFVITGIVYFCYFVYHRFSSITSQILLING